MRKAMTDLPEWAIKEARNTLGRLADYANQPRHETATDTKVVAAALVAARQEGREDAATWHDKEASDYRSDLISMRAENRIRHSDLCEHHEENAAAIRALRP